MASRPSFRLEFDVRGRLLEAARACEADVFWKWYGNSADELDREYGPYDAASAFLALVTDTDAVVGSCRVIVPGPAGLKTVADVSAPPWGVDGLCAAQAARLDLATTWDVATLGVRDGLDGQGRMASAALYHGLIQATRANQVSALVSILDERVRLLLRSVGVVTHPLPGAATRPYLGSSASTPVYGRMPQSLDTWRRIAPEAYRYIALGVGLDAVAVPTLDAFRLRPAQPDPIDLTSPVPVVPLVRS